MKIYSHNYRDMAKTMRECAQVALEQDDWRTWAWSIKSALEHEKNALELENNSK